MTHVLLLGGLITGAVALALPLPLALRAVTAAGADGREPRAGEETLLAWSMALLATGIVSCLAGALLERF